MNKLIVYADVGALFNIIFCIIMLEVSSLLAGTRLKKTAVIVISIPAGIILYFIQLAYLFRSRIYIVTVPIVMFIMVFTCTTESMIYQRILQCIVMAAVSIYAGGLLNAGFCKINNSFFILLILFLSAILLKRIVFRIRRERIQDKSMVTVTLYYGKNSFATTGYIDTGNVLEEPLTGIPVIIVDSKIIECLKNNSEKYGIRIIPYSSLGEKQGIIYGIKLDRLIIYTESGPKYIRDVIAAQDDDIFKGKEYKVLLQGTLV